MEEIGFINLQEDSLCIYKIVGIYKHILKQLAYIKVAQNKSSQHVGSQFRIDENSAYIQIKVGHNKE